MSRLRTRTAALSSEYPETGRVIEEISGEVAAKLQLPALLYYGVGQQGSDIGITDGVWTPIPGLAAQVEVPLDARLAIEITLDTEVDIQGKQTMLAEVRLEGTSPVIEGGSPYLTFRGAQGSEYPTGVRITVPQQWVIPVQAGTYGISVVAKFDGGLPASAARVYGSNSTLRVVAWPAP